MITVRTSPAYVNRVRQDWTANGGVYGDGGVYALVPSNDPFAQSGPTLDLTFAGNPTDLLTASTTAGYTLNTFFTPETYQIAVPYAVWGANGLEQKNFSDIVTFTRASTGTYFNSAGTLTTAAINEARFDYNPSTLAPLGFLIEESRTNSIRNNTMVGVVAGTPGTLPTNWVLAAIASGLTQQIVGTGTDSGINYIDIKLSGATADANGYNLNFEAATQIAAANGQTWASSLYLAIVAGSATNITSIAQRITERSAAGAFLASTDTTITTATSSIKNRFFATRTFNNASTAFTSSAIVLNIASGVAIDITLRIGLPQLEQGAFATSVIPTTTTALTRSADVASVNTLSPWFNAVEGTTYFEGVTFDSTAGSFPRAFQFNDGTNSNVIQVTRNPSSAKARMSVVVGGVAQAADDATTWTLNTNTKVALAYAVNNFAIVANGGAATTDTSGTLPTVTSLLLGSQSGTVSFLNGYLRRVVFYPRRLANADLQTITT
jgi:hypothetical protein